MMPKKRGAPPRRLVRITWKMKADRSLHPFSHVVEKGPEMPKQGPQLDTRDWQQRWLGDPLPGRSALDQKQGDRAINRIGSGRPE